MVRLERLFVGALLSFACVTSVIASQRNDVLVIVNDNSHDSPIVGNYYAQQRNINPANVVHVNIPAQYYLDWNEFQSLRDQILRLGICPTIASSSQPAACSDASQDIYTKENINILTSHTPIKYLVTTRGVPTQVNVNALTGAMSGDASTPTSVDNYLRIWLAQFYTADTRVPPRIREILFNDGRGMQLENPAVDKEYIIGRIDGVNLTSAKALVDRATRTEANGLYGNLFASTFGYAGGVFQWTNYAGQPIYQPSDDTNAGWRYAFGLFGESRPECAEYTTNYLSQQPQGLTTAKAPINCLVQFNLGNEAVPGINYSREPKAYNAIGYFGSLDDQTIEGSGADPSRDGFLTLLNWRKNNTCTVTLCKAAGSPNAVNACKANSTDAFHEINTDCVGVEDGFIGYNFQSFPVAMFGIWPTGWQSVNLYYNQPPIIRSNDGVDDSYSAWFSNPDDVATPKTGKVYVEMRQIVYFDQDSPTTDQTYELSFYTKEESPSPNSPFEFKSGIQASYVSDGSVTNPVCPTNSGYSTNSNGTSCTYTTFKSYSAITDWLPVPINDFTVPAATPGWKLYSVSAKLGSQEGLPPGVNLGFDKVSLKNTNNLANELLTNGSFNQGHEQVSQGDWAANFLDRLGGTAFWGSLSHHGSGGHSFGRSSLGTLIYLMRGLPLGDAAWLGDDYNDGDLYGDPLYSPLAIRINNPSNNSYNLVPQGVLSLTGSALNGTEASVFTSYTMEYCGGSDFFMCDKSDSWMSTGIRGSGPIKDSSLGSWDTANLPTGQYLIRLSVTSANSNSGKQQTFHDFLPVITYNATSDFGNTGVLDSVKVSKSLTPKPNIDSDGDGLPDDAEVYIYHTDPIKPDSDSDGLSDGDEILFLHTNPLKPDTDGDGLSDGDEVHIYHSNPLISDPDTDGDGLLDVVENVIYQTNPLKPDTDGDGLTDTQEVNITHTDPLNPNSVLPNVLDGSLDPFGDGIGYSGKLACGLDVTKSEQGLDSDNDAISDLAECLVGRNPFVNEPALVPNILYMLGF